MIARIEGKLVKLDKGSVLVEVGSLSYEVMLAGYCVSALSGRIDSEVTLCTMEYFEGTPGGGNLIPRLVGFLSDAEKDFFERFISVKGMGIKKGLRALNLPIATVAAAIENDDDKTLISLPGVGKRLAQHIIAELKGKLEVFAAGAGQVKSAAHELAEFQIEALEILIAWGEKRNEVIELIELSCRKHPEVNSAEELVPLVYRFKQGAKV